MTKKLEGLVEGVLVASDPETILSTRLERVKVTLDGFEGEHHGGPTMRSNARQPWYPRGTVIRNSRQVSIVSLEELAQTAEVMGLTKLLPEWYGANLCLQNIPSLTLLPPSTRLFFPDETVLVIDSENGPCTTTGGSIQAQNPDHAGLTTAFPKAAIHKRGVVAWVERPGFINKGDILVVQLAAQITYSF